MNRVQKLIVLPMKHKNKQTKLLKPKMKLTKSSKTRETSANRNKRNQSNSKNLQHRRYKTHESVNEAYQEYIKRNQNKCSHISKFDLFHESLT